MKHTQLSITEIKRFELLEAAAVEGRNTFFIVGSALAEIKDKEYYRTKGFASFEAYAESIGFTKRYCNQLVLDAAVVKALSPEIQKLIKSERAVRELAKVPEQLRETAVELAALSGEVTGASIKAAASPAPPPRRPAPKAAPEPKEKPAKKVTLDQTGVEVPEEVIPLWNRGGEIGEALLHLSIVKCKIEKAQADKDKLFDGLQFSSAIASLNQCYDDLKSLKPFAVCPTCSGVETEGCLLCRGKGFIGKFHWDTCVTQETKDIRGK